MNAPSIHLNHLHDDLAGLWPLVSPGKDYTIETEDRCNELLVNLGHGSHRTLDPDIGWE